MVLRDQDRRVLEALEKAREQHQELADLLDFYYDLYEVQFQVKAGLPEPTVRDELAMGWRLEGGIPQLTFDQLAIGPEAFKETTGKIAAVLLDHNPAWALDPSPLTPEELVGLAQEVFETWDTLTAPAPGQGDGDKEPEGADYTMALTVGFSLAPHLQLAAEAIVPKLDLPLWQQGHCPICGGKPNFAVLDEEKGARHLMCSRCASMWVYPRMGCPFCSTGIKSMYHPSEDELRRLYVCGECNHYLKAVDLRKARRLVLPMVERLLTVGMDLAARQEGYEG